MGTLVLFFLYQQVDVDKAPNSEIKIVLETNKNALLTKKIDYEKQIHVREELKRARHHVDRIKRRGKERRINLFVIKRQEE